MTEFAALRAAALRAARGHRASAEAASFLCELEGNVLELQRRLRGGSWTPAAMRRFSIRDPKPRQISAVPFRDRVVHHALCAVLVPVLERTMVGSSYACRVGKGVGASVRAVQRLTRQYEFFLKVDIRHFFETVDHDVLLKKLELRVGDPAVLALLKQILAAGVLKPNLGLPIGSLCSQHLGNFLLSFLDHYCLRQLRLRAHVRYMDDLLLFHSDRDVLFAKEWEIARFVENYLHQELKFEATQKGPCRVGVPWLGFRVWPRQIRLDAARKRRFLRALRYVREPDRLASRVAWVAQADTRGLRRCALAKLPMPG